MVARRTRRRAGFHASWLFALSIAMGWSAQAMPAPRRAAPAGRPFDGFWAADRAGCRDPDSTGRMAIQRNTIRWYETRCEIGTISPLGGAAWRLGLACSGEGQRIAARATVRLLTADQLTVEDGPIGPSRRQRYIRCLAR